MSMEEKVLRFDPIFDYPKGPSMALNLKNGRFVKYEDYDALQQRHDKEMGEFAEWCGTNYVKCHGGWWPRYAKETTENIVSTQNLIDLWKNARH